MNETNGKTTSNKRAIFVVSQKGGVGKTTWARAYLDLARKAGVNVAAYDADGQVGQLLQYHGTRTGGRLDTDQDPVKGVGYFDVRDDKQRDELINALSLQADVILMDMPGGSVQEMAKVLGDGKKDDPDASRALVRAYKKYGYEVVVVVVISNVISSVRTVSETVNLFGDEAKYVVVKNKAFGDADEFVVFEGYKDAQGQKRHGKGREAIGKAGGEVIVMPRMQPNTYGIVDVESVPFTKVGELEHILLADKMRVDQWLDQFVESLSGTVVSL
jgi:hypothetical protein